MLFSDRKQQLHLYKNGQQDCTCYVKPPPFQLYNTNTEILKFNTSIKTSDCIFMKALFEIVSKCKHRNDQSNMLT